MSSAVENNDTFLLIFHNMICGQPEVDQPIFLSTENKLLLDKRNVNSEIFIQIIYYMVIIIINNRPTVMRKMLFD